MDSGMPDETRTVTGLLRDWRAGDAVAGNRLMDAVYTELHRMASSRMRRGRGEHTFQPTALVHELYLRLSDSTVDWRDCGHFYAVAAQQLRRVLTDYARRRGSEKRAGNLLRVPLADFDAQTVQLDERLLAV